MGDVYFIYALYCEDFPARVRYVGLTTKTIRERFKGHLKNARHGVKYPVYNWIRKNGERVTFRELERCSTRGELSAAEVKWIAHFRSLGMADLNITDGGEGTSGWRMTDEQREVKRQYLLENPIVRETTPEMREAVAESNRRRLETLEARQEHANKVGKLREKTVAEIKVDIWNGATDKECASKYGVSFGQISNIRHGKSWSFVPWPVGPMRKTRRSVVRAGSTNGASKLTEDDVREIRRVARRGFYPEVADKFGVSVASISNIVARKSWKHVK